MGVTLIVSALSPGRDHAYFLSLSPSPALGCLRGAYTRLPTLPAPSSLACPRLSLTEGHAHGTKVQRAKKSPPQHCPSTAHCVCHSQKLWLCLSGEGHLQVLPGKVPAFLLGGEEAGNRSAGPGSVEGGLSLSRSAFWRVSSSKEEQVVLLEQGSREPRYTPKGAAVFLPDPVSLHSPQAFIAGSLPSV